jgi:hypothetical protein
MPEPLDNRNTEILRAATDELNRQLLVGSYSQRLMRVYALSEIIELVSPELLLQAAATISLCFPDGELEADEESRIAA